MSNPTVGLVADIFAVLDAHGYRRGDDRSVGVATVLLADLLDGYEGRIDSLRQPRPDSAGEGAE